MFTVPFRRRPHRASSLHFALALCLLCVGCSDDDGPTSPGGAEPVAETIELILTARDGGDKLLPTDAKGVTRVEVGEEFILELSYIDHRPESERLGASQIFVDLLAGRTNVLRPVLGETLRLVVGGEIQSADPSGTVSFFTPGSAASPAATGAEFLADPEGEFISAMTAFGYTLDEDYSLTRLDSGNQDIGLEITWNNARHGNVNMPNISALTDFNIVVPTQTIEFAPFEPDGVTVNSAALRFNIDTRSRGYNDNEAFFIEQVGGDYDPTEGFTQMGGIGPRAGGGVPELSDDGSFPQPFDAFSLRVELVAPVTGLTVSATPSQAGDGISMYGLAEDLPSQEIRMDGDHALIIDAVAP